MKNKDLICENLSVNEKGVLNFAGVDTVEMANKYGTPLFLMDEERIRYKCKTYINAVKKYFGENSGVLYASKALSFKRIYEIMKEEGFEPLNTVYRLELERRKHPYDYTFQEDEYTNVWRKIR